MNAKGLLDDPKVIPAKFSLLETPSVASYHNQWFEATFENMRQMIALESSAVQQTLKIITPINATQKIFNNLSNMQCPVPFIMNGLIAPRIPDNYENMVPKAKKKFKMSRAELITHANIHKSILYPRFFLKPIGISIPRVRFQPAKFQYCDRLSSVCSPHSSMSLWYRERCIHSFFISGHFESEFHPHLGCYVLKLGNHCVCYSLADNTIRYYSEPIRQFILPPRFSFTIVLTDKNLAILSLPDLSPVNSIPLSDFSNVAKLSLKVLPSIPCFLVNDSASNTSHIYSCRALRKLVSLQTASLPGQFEIVPVSESTSSSTSTL